MRISATVFDWTAGAATVRGDRMMMRPVLQEARHVTPRHDAEVVDERVQQSLARRRPCSPPGSTSYEAPMVFKKPTTHTSVPESPDRLFRDLPRRKYASPIRPPRANP